MSMHTQFRDDIQSINWKTTKHIVYAPIYLFPSKAVIITYNIC